MQDEEMKSAGRKTFEIREEGNGWKRIKNEEVWRRMKIRRNSIARQINSAHALTARGNLEVHRIVSRADQKY